MSDLTIIAVSNQTPDSRHNYLFDESMASIRRYGLEPVLIGQGEYQGLGSRPRILKHAIESGKVPTPYMLFMDAWDIVFQDSPEEVLEWHRDRTHLLTWNAEKNCFPAIWMADRHPKTNSPWKYLNSGFAVGETQAFLLALEAMHADEIADDHTNVWGKRIEPCCQFHWMREFILQSVPMALDTQCEICQTMHGVTPDELDFSGPKIKNVVTGSKPIALHLNGSSRNEWAREPILRKLGL